MQPSPKNGHHHPLIRSSYPTVGTHINVYPDKCQPGQMSYRQMSPGHTSYDCCRWWEYLQLVSKLLLRVYSLQTFLKEIFVRIKSFERCSRYKVILRDQKLKIAYCSGKKQPIAWNRCLFIHQILRCPENIKFFCLKLAVIQDVIIQVIKSTWWLKSDISSTKARIFIKFKVKPMRRTWTTKKIISWRSEHACARMMQKYVRACFDYLHAHIFTKNFMVVNVYIMSLNWKFASVDIALLVIRWVWNITSWTRLITMMTQSNHIEELLL